jgi:hypothetical protein
MPGFLNLGDFLIKRTLHHDAIELYEIPSQNRIHSGNRWNSRFQPRANGNAGRLACH